MPRITKLKFLEVLDVIIKSFNKEALKADSSNAAKSFLALHSYLSTTTSDKTFPKERIERLYNALFSKYDGAKVIEEPMRDYDSWCERAEKLASRIVVESAHVDEGDDVQFDWDYFSKELVRDLILGGAASGFLATGNVPLAAASIAVPAIIHGVNNELDKRGKSIDRGKFKKLFNIFRDTFDKLEKDMNKFIIDTDFSDKQLDDIERSANSIYNWWKNNATNVTKDWDKYNDKEIIEFIDKYNMFIENVTSTATKSNKESVSSMSVVKVIDDLEESIKKSKSDKDVLVESFMTISTLVTALCEEDGRLSMLDDKVSELYDAMFAEYDKYGKMVKRAPLSYAALKTFIRKNTKKINDTVEKSMEQVKESQVNEAFDGVKNFFSNAAKNLAGIASNAINILFFEIALYGKMFLTGAMSLGPVVTILSRRVTYYAAEDASAKIMSKVFKNVSSDAVQKKILKILDDIRQEVRANEKVIDEALRKNLHIMSKSIDGIKAMTRRTNESFEIMSFEEFKNLC